MLLVLCVEQEGTLNPPQKLFWDAKGPLWYRGLADSPNCGEVEKMLKNIGARRMVVGHTRDDEVRPGVIPGT